MQDLFENEIIEAAQLLKKGEVVAFPTETVYGLGARLFDEGAIRKIFALKGRPSDNPLIVHIASLEDLGKLCRCVPLEAYLLAKRFWPGPLSILLDAKPEVPSIARAGLPTIAIRMPAHKIAISLIEKAEQPLVAPSANLSGKPSATKAEHVRHDFGDKLPILDGGPCERGLESTVIDLRDPKWPKVLRPGAISRAILSMALGVEVELGDEKICPGTRYRHYAPKATVHLCRDVAQVKRSSTSMVLTCADGTLSETTLYETLRRADVEGIEEIFIFCDDELMANEGLYNRILKASSRSELI